MLGDDGGQNGHHVRSRGYAGSWPRFTRALAADTTPRPRHCARPPLACRSQRRRQGKAYYRVEFERYRPAAPVHAVVASASLRHGRI
jgi:hypothetical protein